MLLALGLWLQFGRDRGQADDQPATAGSEGSARAAVRPGARPDSTATLIRSDKATIVGTVRDEQGQGIPGATVCAWSDVGELRGAGDGRPRCVTSERDGHYRIEQLWPVSTSVSASAPEFKPARWSERVAGRVRHQLRLAAGQERRDIDLVLARGG
ncbi:MAG TPA: carboxypeptidase-like regulatory domain-containing protein, partial [Enhygromyxa sp.]|nr:carboxypeptidase-like regulatory domain-containing protein [Enhygromyxa sp.]